MKGIATDAFQDSIFLKYSQSFSLKKILRKMRGNFKELIFIYPTLIFSL